MRLMTDGDVIKFPNLSADFIEIKFEIVLGKHLISLYTNLPVEDTEYFLERKSLAKEGVIKHIWGSLLSENIRFVSLGTDSVFVTSKLFSVGDIDSVIVYGGTLNYRKEGELYYTKIDLRWEDD